MHLRSACLLCVITFTVAACGGGTKLVKHVQPLPVQRALSEASDQRLGASLDWVLVRNGPGAWAKNADWDEYLIRVNNSSPEPIRITGVAVFDSLGTRIESKPDRKQLVKGSKESARRYRNSGLKIQAGMGGAGLMATGAAVGVAGYGVALGSAASSFMGGTAATGGAVAAASVMLVAAPVLAVFGIVRAVHNSQVSGEIERRQTRLPAVIPAGQSSNLDIFFPLAPSPGRIEISYADAQGEHQLVVDTRVAMAGLHLERGKAGKPAVGAGLSPAPASH